VKPRDSADKTDQVFYGRYLRKLSNLTQEAIGDMSKVSRTVPLIPLPVTTVARSHLILPES
jgi:hypothetical protein